MKKLQKRNEQKKRLETLLFNTIVAWYDESQYAYSGLDDEEFIDNVCDRTGITKEEYHHIMHSDTITEDEAIKRLDGYRYTQNFLFTSDNKVIDIAIQAIKERQLIIDILKNCEPSKCIDEISKVIGTEMLKNDAAASPVEYDGEEMCPYCDHLNPFIWDGHTMTITCEECGEKMLLCSMCDRNYDCNNCPYETANKTEYLFDDDGNEYYIDSEGKTHYTRDER